MVFSRKYFPCVLGNAGGTGRRSRRAGRFRQYIDFEIPARILNICASDFVGNTRAYVDRNSRSERVVDVAIGR